MDGSRPSPATYEDLRALPAELRAEIIAGAIHVKPSPVGRHSRSQRALGGRIGKAFDDDDGFGGPGGWWILIEIDIELGPQDVVRPDLVGWRRENLSDPWDSVPIRVRPDWICELIAPSNAAHDRGKKKKKRALYARAGVPHYWIVDPRERVLEALELQGGAWLELGSFGDGDRDRIRPFEAIELAISRLFVPRPAEGA